MIALTNFSNAIPFYWYNANLIIVRKQERIFYFDVRIHHIILFLFNLLLCQRIYRYAIQFTSKFGEDTQPLHKICLPFRIHTSHMSWRYIQYNPNYYLCLKALWFTLCTELFFKLLNNLHKTNTKMNCIKTNLIGTLQEKSLCILLLWYFSLFSIISLFIIIQI